MILPDYILQKMVKDGLYELGYEYPLVEPEPADHQYQPASIDLLLGDNVAWLSEPPVTRLPLFGGGDDEVYIVDPYNPDWMKRRLPRYHSIHLYEYEFTLKPKQLALAETWETVAIPNGFVGRVEGKSSLARFGLFAHVTAGFIDPGFHGKITLELFNASDYPIILRHKQPICQLAVEKMSNPSRRMYGNPGLKSRYQGARGLEGSKAGEDL